MRNWLLALAGIVVLLVVLAMIGVNTRKSSLNPDDDIAEMKRVIAEDFLVQMQVKCLSRPLTKAQKEYLIANSQYVMQHYLLALEIDDQCANRALRKCESIYPGQCVALPGELHGKRAP